MKVAVVGVGRMGYWLANFAKENLGETVIADLDEKKAKKVAAELGVEYKTPLDAAVDADIVLVAVPISKTVEVVKALADVVKPKSLIADVSSVKEEIVHAMGEIGKKMELASFHPLFGPGATTIKGKDMVVVPVRKGSIYNKTKKILVKVGVKVTEMGAEEHDKIMAIIQCMTHYTVISYLIALHSLKDFEQLRGIKTPMFAALTNLATAVLSGNPEVFGELQVHNRYSRLVRHRVMESCKRLNTIFSAKDAKSMENVFEEALKFYGTSAAKKAYDELYQHFEEGEK